MVGPTHIDPPFIVLMRPDSQSYVLNFSDRVSQASVKNFQVVHHLDRNASLVGIHLMAHAC